MNQGCGAGTQISGSGSNSKHLNFLTSAPTSKRFWLRLQNDLVKWNKKLLFYFYNSLHSKLCLVNGNPNFRLWLRIHHLKFVAPASAPGIQNFLGSGSTALVWSVTEKVSGLSEEIMFAIHCTGEIGFDV